MTDLASLNLKVSPDFNLNFARASSILTKRLFL